MQRHQATQPTSPRPGADGAKAGSTLVNRNVTVAGHRTSIRLEPTMWEALRQICEREHKPINEVVTEIARQRIESSLTAAIREYIVRYFPAAATGEAPRLAGHGASRPQLTV